MIFGGEASDLPFRNFIAGPECLNLPANDHSASQAWFWVEGKRPARKVHPICFSPFPLGVPNRKLVSSPCPFKPIVPISSDGLTCSLPVKGYVTDAAGWTFGSDHG
jgi:hypothetical protein